jgi:hypothetical protein
MPHARDTAECHAERIRIYVVVDLLRRLRASVCTCTQCTQCTHTAVLLVLLVVSY